MRTLFILLLIFLPGRALSQDIPDMGLFKVRIITGDGNISAEIKPVSSKPAVKADCIYYWYGSNKINQTQGGFSGTLLNGQYQSYYNNKNLKEQGLFDNGLRSGIWKDWTDGGVLTQSTTWKKGIKQGEFEVYDDKGDLKQKGTYKDGQLNGKTYSYNAKGEASITYYQNGKPTAEPLSFWQRINIFKKKD